ncbi:hypothetical protein KD146_07560 [Devosia sp. BSSL-BM10]|uniref:Uncharacterized protein n=1 Tax=Devosia litorisediminis TaxID=2829817 RepID=A0A942EEX9_9HYPH|nr:hypothetical protein [Devosia litorisediminis]MBS3848551.1 hypothetical protein [Devosia litorisediminis]
MGIAINGLHVRRPQTHLHAFVIPSLSARNRFDHRFHAATSLVRLRFKTVVTGRPDEPHPERSNRLQQTRNREVRHVTGQSPSTIDWPDQWTVFDPGGGDPIHQGTCGRFGQRDHAAITVLVRLAPTDEESQLTVPVLDHILGSEGSKFGPSAKPLKAQSDQRLVAFARKRVRAG